MCVHKSPSMGTLFSAQSAEMRLRLSTWDPVDDFFKKNHYSLFRFFCVCLCMGVSATYGGLEDNLQELAFSSYHAGPTRKDGTRVIRLGSGAFTHEAISMVPVKDIDGDCAIPGKCVRL